MGCGDFSPGGRGMLVLEKVKADIREGKFKPMEEGCQARQATLPSHTSELFLDAFPVAVALEFFGSFGILGRIFWFRFLHSIILAGERRRLRRTTPATEANKAQKDKFLRNEAKRSFVFNRSCRRNHETDLELLLWPESSAGNPLSPK